MTTPRWNYTSPEERVEETQFVFTRLDGIFRSGTSNENLRNSPQIRRETDQAMVDAPPETERHRVPPIPGQVSL